MRGLPVEVEEICAKHPDRADELRTLDEAWQRVAPLHDALGGADPLHERIERQFGDVAADVDLDASKIGSSGSGHSVANRAVRDLEAHAPRRSRYQLQGEIARGGMGAVLEVRDEDLRRTLAMKVMLGGSGEASDAESQAERERQLARFLEEAQITGQLEHPGIVPVHELGLDEDGRVYFTMPLVRGRDLEAVIDLVHRGEEGWTLSRALRVVLRACEAMGYAHAKGVVHRDLKPANIMVGRHGEVYVMDWGLARVLGREERPVRRAASASDTIVNLQTVRQDERDSGPSSVLSTLDGEVLGTPAYMAPEQAYGQLDSLDARTDVFSIGAILYHLVAGHRPYVPPGSKRNAIDVWQAVKDGPPDPLLESAPDAPQELVAIIEKATARKPGERYADTAELGEDLSRYLDGHVVAAYEAGALAELRKWVGRNRATAAWAMAAALTLLVGLAGVAVVQSRANRELADKNVALELATAEARSAERAAQAAERQAVERAEEVRLERDAGERVIAFLEDLFESPDPSRARGATVTAKELLDRGAASISTDESSELNDRAAARLRVAMGRAYLALGLYADAEPLTEAAWLDRSERLGESDAGALAALVDLGLARTGLGLYDEASPLLEQAFDLARAALGPLDALTLRAQDALGGVRFRQGRYDDAVDLLEAALEGRSETHGPRAPETFETMRDLALVHRKVEDFAAARPLFERARDGLAATQGDDDPRTLMAVNDLAGLAVMEGNRDGALPLFEEALEGRLRVLGEDHPDTLITLNDLAYLHQQRGHPELAEPLYVRTLAAKRAALGDDHPETLTTINNLGALYFRSERYAEAEPLYAEAVAGNVKRRGEEHPNTCGALYGLGSVYVAQGRFDHALPILSRAVASARAAFGPTHGNTLAIQEALVRTYADLDQLAEAETLASDLVERSDPERAGHDGRLALRDELRATLAERSASDG